VETAVIDLAERGVRSSVGIANIAHSTTDRAGFLLTLVALAQDKGFAGYPGDGANLWNAAHIRDVASLFRLALGNGPAGKHATRFRMRASRSASVYLALRQPTGSRST
jgi:nucleoside-diphosphate-sugar epimerase